MALCLRRAAVFGLESFTKFPSAPYLIAPRTYNVRGILLWFTRVLVVMHHLEHVCPVFLDCLPTVNRSSVIPHDNRVFCVECGHGGGILVGPCLVKFFMKCENLLA